MQLNSGEKDRVGAWEHGACFVLPMGGRCACLV
jgi:hypothetical protein